MPFTTQYYVMLKRKLIYTGITRAKKTLLLIGDPQAMHLGIRKIEIERKTILKEELVPADSAIIAISQGPKDKLIMSTDHLLGNSKGLLITDENCMTTVDGVFAAGDVVTGPLTVVHATEAAKRAAEAMMRYMEKEDTPAQA